MKTVLLSYCLALLGMAAVMPAMAESDVNDLRRLGERYEHGEGVAQDHAQAYAYYCQAARRGDGAAAFNLAWMYLNGRGRPRDDALAAGWLQQAARHGDTHATQLLARLGQPQAKPDGACAEPSRMTRRFDRRFASLVREIAPEFGIDPELALAIIQVESGFDPKAESPKLAKGLMQLLPETATRFQVTDIWDPEQNIRGGLRYLRWLLKRFEGQVHLAVAAYNAGEGAVERYAGIPPYRETQQYVRKVSALYPQPSHPLPKRADKTDS